MITITKLLSLITLISFSAAAQVMQKKGVLDLDLRGWEVSGMLHNYWLLGGIFLMGLTFILYLLILSKNHLGRLYPVFASGTIVLITIISLPLFDENLSLPQIIGIFIIVFGIFLMFFKRHP